MMKCDCCRGEFRFNELENWGHVTLCPECVKYYISELPEKQKSRHMELKIKNPLSGRRAEYDPKKGNLVFTGSVTYHDAAEVIINHEFMHYILHKRVGLKTCYQYDCISDEIDPYHDTCN